MIAYSLLDLSPIPQGSSPGVALANTLDLARHAERWGYTRYWLAEHHNMPGIASAATAVVIGQIANAGVPLVGIYGMPRQDMSLVSTDPKRVTCDAVSGQPVSVDTQGGVRSLALKGLLAVGCHMDIDKVQQVAMGSNTASALASGQLVFGIAHLDDATRIHHRNPVGKILDDAEIMGNEQVGHACLALQLGEQIEDLRLDRHIKRRSRLIKNHHLRANGQRPRDRDSLALAARELVRVTVCRIRRHADALEQRADARIAVRLVPLWPQGCNPLVKDCADPHARIK